MIQLAASLKSVTTIADEMKRSPESIAKMAARLGISLKPDRTSSSKPVLRPWTAEEQKKLHDLLRAGKDPGEIAAALRRTRHAVYVRLRRLNVRPTRSWRPVELGLKVKK